MQTEFRCPLLSRSHRGAILSFTVAVFNLPCPVCHGVLIRQSRLPCTHAWQFVFRCTNLIGWSMQSAIQPVTFFVIGLDSIEAYVFGRATNICAPNGGFPSGIQLAWHSHQEGIRCGAMSRLWMHVISMYIHRCPARNRSDSGRLLVHNRTNRSREIIHRRVTSTTPTTLYHTWNSQAGLPSSPSLSSLLSNNITDPLERQSPHIPQMWS